MNKNNNELLTGDTDYLSVPRKSLNDKVTSSVEMRIAAPEAVNNILSYAKKLT